MNAELQAELDPAAVAREPTQQRARERFERVLQEAEAVLQESGLAGFSIPVLAERLGMTRGSVYAYFPTPYAILNELVSRHLAGLEALFLNRAQELLALNWQDGIEVVVRQAVNYHNQHPAARLLILGGAVSDTSYRSLESLLKRLGNLARQIWQVQGHEESAMNAELDVFTLSVDIGVACFRRSFFEHGEITADYEHAAVQAMRRFLQPYLEPNPEQRDDTRL